MLILRHKFRDSTGTRRETSYSVVKPGMSGLVGHKYATPRKSKARTCPSKLLTARRGAHSPLLQSSI